MVKVYTKFDRIIDARKAVETLKSMGYHSAQIDIADKFYNEFSAELGISGKGADTNLSDVFLNSKSKPFNVDKGPLIASDPVMSGNGPNDVMMDTNVHLLVNVDEKQLSDVEKKLSDLGGRKP